MQEKQDHALNTIIKTLHLNKTVDPNVLDDLQFIRYSDIAGYVGLINLLYNIVNRELSAEDDNQGMVEQNPQPYRGSQILKMRGQILKEYAKMLRGVLPDPAYFLARFDYESFNQYCVHRGVPYLTRHTRGIYPQIDTKKTPLLQFLPFYNDLMTEQALVGNYNHIAARRRVEMFYNTEIKAGHIKEQKMEEENGSKSNLINLRQNAQNNSQQQLRNGVMLTYIMILEKTDEMQQYISSLKDFIQNAAENEEQLSKDKLLFDRFEFWYRNYKSYVREGMKMYERGQDNVLYPLVYACDGNNLEQTIINVIKLVVALKETSNKADIIKQIEQKLKVMVELVKDNNVVPSDPTQYKNNNKNLLLAYLYTIDKMLFKNRPDKSLPFIAYRELSTFCDPAQQPYNRIFYNDHELVELYESGTINQFPTRYDYDLLDKPILRAICHRNPDKLEQNIRRLKMMNSAERLRLLVRSPLLGDIKVENGHGGLTLGEKILSNLKNYEDQFLRDLINENGRELDPKAATNQLHQFIKDWHEYYQGMRNFNTQSMQKFIISYGRESKKNVILKLIRPEPEAKLKIGQLIHPMSRPDIIYTITRSLAEHLEKLDKQYVNNLQKLGTKQRDYKTENDLKLQRNSLVEVMKIYQQDEWKEMVAQADPTFLIDSEQDTKKQETLAKQEEHQEYVWKAYANTFLSLGDCCNKLIQLGECEGESESESEQEDAMDVEEQ